MFERALVSPADSLVLDLEDSVTPERKAAAREEVRDWLAGADFAGRERVVRINPPEGDLWEEDLEVTMASSPDAYMLPKVGGADDLLRVDERLRALEARAGVEPGRTGVIPIATETAEGLLNVREIARGPRVLALTWGAEDLSADLGARANRDADGRYLEVFRYARVMTLLAAKAAGVQAIDGVYTDFRDTDGLRLESAEAAQMGYDGKLTIHPAQLETVNAAFTPTDEEVRESRELLAAFEENRRAGRMAFSHRGQMVDVPHLNRARAILERAECSG